MIPTNGAEVRSRKEARGQGDALDGVAKSTHGSPKVKSHVHGACALGLELKGLGLEGIGQVMDTIRQEFGP